MLQWELNRALATLYEEEAHLAACAVWDVTGTLLITLLGDYKSDDVHLQALHKFIREEWVV